MSQIIIKHQDEIFNITNETTYKDLFEYLKRDKPLFVIYRNDEPITDLNEKIDSSDDIEIKYSTCQSCQSCKYLYLTDITDMEGNHMECLKFALTKHEYEQDIDKYDCEQEKQEALKHALEENKHEYVYFLLGEKIDLDEYIMRSATGNLEMTKLLHSYNCPWDETAYDYAETLEVVKYLFENGCPCNEEAYIDSDLEVIKYLHYKGVPYHKSAILKRLEEMKKWKSDTEYINESIEYVTNNMNKIFLKESSKTIHYFWRPNGHPMTIIC